MEASMEDRLKAIEDYIQNEKSSQKKSLLNVMKYPMTTDEAFPPGKDEVDQPKTHYDIDRSVSIEYFLKGVSQAKLLICKGSNQADRERLAKENGVLEFDQFRLDGVRVIAMLTDQNGFVDHHGHLWIVDNNS